MRYRAAWAELTEEVKAVSVSGCAGAPFGERLSGEARPRRTCSGACPAAVPLLQFWCTVITET